MSNPPTYHKNCEHKDCNYQTPEKATEAAAASDLMDHIMSEHPND